MNLKSNLNCLGKNKEKYNPFSIPMKKEITIINKDGNQNVDNVSYKIKFIDSIRFMTTSLSNLVDSLAEGIHKIKCKDCDCFLEYESVKDNLIKYKCFSCNKDYSNNPDEKFKKRSKKMFNFSSNDVNKLNQLLRKCVYPYECMNDLEKFNETALLKKKNFIPY